MKNAIEAKISVHATMQWSKAMMYLSGYRPEVTENSNAVMQYQ